MKSKAAERTGPLPPFRTRRGVRFAAVAAAWVLLPAATIAAVSVNLAAVPVTGEAGSVFAPVRDASGLASEPIDIVLGWSAGFDIFAPSWSGVVQRVDIGPGSAVTEGAVVARVSGIDRMFALTSLPLHRTLALGDSGPEVAELNAFLVRRGFAASEGSSYTADTGQAVQAFASSIGAPSTREFDPSWVVWAPDVGEIRLDEVALVAGEVAAANIAVARSAPTLEWAQLVRPSSVTPSVGESVAPVSRPDPGIVVAAAESQMLMVGGAAIMLSENRDEVAPEGLSVLQGVLPATNPLATGNLVRDVTDAVAVPTASLISDGPIICVVVRGAADSVTAVPVSVLADAVGQTIVAGDLAAGESVEVAAPSERRSCRS